MKVSISHEECRSVERLFYKHMSNLNTLNYLIMQGAEEEQLIRYNNIVTDLFMELEKEKERVVAIYQPEGNFIKYIFLFDEDAIEFFDE